MSAKLLEFYGVIINQSNVDYLLMNDNENKFTFSVADMQDVYNATGSFDVTKMDVLIGATSSMVSRKCTAMYINDNKHSLSVRGNAK